MSLDPIDEKIIEALRRFKRPVIADVLVAWVDVQITPQAVRARLRKMQQAGCVGRPSGVRKGWALAA